MTSPSGPAHVEGPPTLFVGTHPTQLFHADA